jgi:DNA processing protein
VNDERERHALVALTLIPGLGPGRIKNLIEYCGSASAVFKTRSWRLAAIPGIGPRISHGIIAFNRFDLVEQQFCRADRVGARMVRNSDPEYPQALNQIYDPPAFLWIRGTYTEPDHYSVAIVGTRRATSYGLHVAARLAAGLAERGITVVSGLAHGVDGAAHRGALQAGGRTVGVLGSGIDRIYPSSHRALAMQMIDSGCLVSEFALGTKPDAPNFPRRNRLISGLSLGTVVVEAYEEGGALITARLACEQNREVFAVPSPIAEHDGRGSGCNRLIQRGHAKLIMSVDDILAELPPTNNQSPPTGEADPSPNLEPNFISSEEEALWDVLEHQPVHLDTICSKSELDPSTALVHLLNLEFRGLIRQLAGKQFVRN